MNKKVFCFLCILVVAVSMMTTNAETDLFYYRQDEAFKESVEKDIDILRVSTVPLLDKEKLAVDGEIQPEKLTFDTEKIYACYKWDMDKAIAFMNAKNRAAYLETLEIDCWLFPALYEGQPIEDFAAAFRADDTRETGFMPDSAGTVERYRVLADRDRLQKTLQSIGAMGYSIVMSGNLNGLLTVMAEKDGESYYILLPYNDTYAAEDGSALQKARKQLPELYSKRILNEKEFKEFSACFISPTTRGEGSQLLMGQGNSATENAETEEPTVGIEPIWFAIGGAALLIAAAVAIALLTKKKAN